MEQQNGQTCGVKKIFLRTLFLVALVTSILHLALFLPKRGAFSPNIVIGKNADQSGSAMTKDLAAAGRYGSRALKPRYHFRSYEEYLQLQLNKTLNPKLRQLWTSRDWRRKVTVFSRLFGDLMKKGIVNSRSKVLCIGARVGQEVLALKEIGVGDVIGIDLVPSPPLVIHGDMHKHPFGNDTFDFEFSNAFDHALFPEQFAAEIERTLKPGGYAVIHVSLKKRGDKYSANDLYHVDALLSLFKNSVHVHTRRVDAFGLDTEVVLRKQKPVHNNSCQISSARRKIIDIAEPLISEEPAKPWLAFKRNLKNIKYLPTQTSIAEDHKSFAYIDIGARSYVSSIGSWFTKLYPKQSQQFAIYAIEADKSFTKSYMKRPHVKFLPYAAWVRNESLLFGASKEDGGNSTAAEERGGGMGHIQKPSLSSPSGGGATASSSKQFDTVQGFDFAEWLARTVSPEDFVVVKMDIEGTEFDLIPHLIGTGAMCLIDELFLECHYNRWQRTSPGRSPKYSKTYGDCLSLFQSLRNHGVLAHQWW